MDFSKLKPGDKLTPEQLQKLEDQVIKNNERIAELQKIGTSPETPDEGELMTHSNRAMSGFAEDDAIIKMTQAGYTDMHRNKGGDWVAKGPDGRWYADSHGPAAFVERHLGDLPGLGGMAVGGAVGTAAGAAAGAAAGSPAGPPGMAGGAAAYAPYGAVAGAGAGAAGGEALRQWIGQKLGVRDAPVNGSDVAIEGALGALGEGAVKGAGAAAARIPVRGTNLKALLSELADKYAVQPLKRGTAVVAGSLSGAGKEAAERVLSRPDEMLAAGKDIAGKAEKAGDYLNFQDRVYGKDVGEARNAFQVAHGDKVVDTTPLLKQNASAMERYAPNKAGSGPLSQEDWDMLRKLQKEEYATPRVIKDPVYGVEQGVEHVPEQTLGSLQRTADQLDKDVGPANWKRAAEDKPVQRTKSYISEAKKQRHSIKELLHMEDSNLARADKQYSDFARDAEPVANLSSRFKQEKEYNEIAKAIAKGTDKEKVDAAGRVLGNSMEDLMDTGMSQRFDTPKNIVDFLRPTPRKLLQLGLGAGAVGAGQANPELEYSLGAGALLLEPALIKQLLARAAKAAPGAAAAGARGAELSGAKSIWSLFNQEKKDGKE